MHALSAYNTGGYWAGLRYAHGVFAVAHSLRYAAPPGAGEDRLAGRALPLYRAGGASSRMTEAVRLLPAPTQRTAAALLSRTFAYDADVLPLSYDGAVLTVAVPSDSAELLERLRQLTRKEIRSIVLPVREIREALKGALPGSSSARHRLASGANPR